MRKLLLATVAALGASMGVATVADAQTASPAPGTVTVRLNGRFRFYGAIVQDRDVDNNSSTTSTGTVNAAGQGTASGRNKQTNYGFGDYARLFPGFDGVASNGLKYGAALEIRQDNTVAPGGGANGSISAAGRALGMSYRRAWLLVDTMNRCFNAPLVETQSGGGKAAGARLTQAGEAALAAYRGLSAQLEEGVSGPGYASLEAAIRQGPLP